MHDKRQNEAQSFLKRGYLKFFFGDFNLIRININLLLQNYLVYTRKKAFVLKSDRVKVSDRLLEVLLE